jgi:GntR family transcriptional regulator
MLAVGWSEVNYMTYMNSARPLLQWPRMENATRRVAEVPLGESLTSVPLYREVKTRLTRGLAAGEWKPGEAIPSESRLAERFGVSIGTVRKAIDELVAERILLRQQGRGTFVATHTEDRTLFYFFHIVGKDGSRELPVTELLSFRKARASATEAEHLAITTGATVFRILNVLKLGGRPVLVDDITVPQSLFPDLDENVFGGREGTIYGLYQARYGITVTRISERISAVHPVPRIASLLALADGTPALVIKRVAYTYGDTPVEYRVSSVNSERHEYLSDLWRPQSANGRGY